MNLPYLTNKLLAKEELPQEEARAAMEIIAGGSAPGVQVASFLTALKAKGEKAAELAGFCEVLRSKVTPVSTTRQPLVDTCGTGGDNSGTFNISTAAALVAAGAGAAVAKHGNRAVSGRCGSADVLQSLDVHLELSPRDMGCCLDQVGISFLYAPLLHPAFQKAGPVRREMGISTVFNLLGPLTNPAAVQRQVVGVFHPALTELLGETLLLLGTEHALVVHGLDGLDELSVSAPTLITEINKGTLSTYHLDPVELGLPKAPPGALKGDTGPFNASLITRILEGEKGHRRHAVLLNAAAVLLVAGICSTIKEGLSLAADSIDRGLSLNVLKQLQRFTRERRKGLCSTG